MWIDIESITCWFPKLTPMESDAQGYGTASNTEAELGVLLDEVR